MGDLSLLSGWLLAGVIVVVVVSTLLAIGWRDERWRRHAVVAAVVTIVVVGSVALVDWLITIVPFDFPPSFYAYLALAVFAASITVLGFRRDDWWRRAVGVVAVLSTLVLFGLIVNDQYQYYPTIDNLLGKVADHESDLPALADMKAQVKQTGQLPDDGVVLHLDIPGTTSDFHGRQGFVYVPPAYFADPAPDLPVLMLLHGVPGAPSDWIVAGGAETTADRFAAEHDGKAPILVMPDITGDDTTDTGCADTARGNVETYLVDDVPNFVRATFGVADDAKWGVAGLSLGGYCSLMLPLRHPGQFTVFGDYSGLATPALDPPGNALPDLFGGNQQKMDSYDPTKILPTRSFEDLSGWFEVGSGDSDPLKDTRAVVTQAQHAGIATCLLIRPGSHDFNFWTAAFQNSLPWMSARLGLVPLPVDTHGADCSGP